MITIVEPAITVAASADRALVTDIITRAFAADPPSRWLYPDDDQYWRFFPRFIEAFGGSAIGCGTAEIAADGGAAALWLPPGAHPDEAAVGTLLEESVDPARLETAFLMFERMARYPSAAALVLPLIGVHPAQGRGWLGAPRDAAARCDREGLPAYSNRREACTSIVDMGSRWSRRSGGDSHHRSSDSAAAQVIMRFGISGFDLRIWQILKS
jgi:hypothetical protein